MIETFPASGSSNSFIVQAHLESWFETQSRIEQSTLKGYRAAINFWVNAFGSKLLRALKHSDISEAIAARPDLSGKTLNNYTGVLGEAMKLAVLDRVIDSNPMENVPKAKWQKPPVDPFTADETEAITTELRAGTPARCTT